MSNIGTGANASVRITVDKWSTPEERKMLIETMVEKGPDALLKALQKQCREGPILSIPGLMGPDPNQLRLGHSLRYAWQTPLAGGGRRIVIVTDRYVELRRGAEPAAHDGLPLHPVRDSRWSPMARARARCRSRPRSTSTSRPTRVELENYSSEPVRLNAVQVKVKK